MTTGKKKEKLGKFDFFNHNNIIILKWNQIAILSKIEVISRLFKEKYLLVFEIFKEFENL